MDYALVDPNYCNKWSKSVDIIYTYMLRPAEFVRLNDMRMYAFPLT